MTSAGTASSPQKVAVQSVLGMYKTNLEFTRAQIPFFSSVLFFILSILLNTFTVRFIFQRDNQKVCRFAGFSCFEGFIFYLFFFF